MRISDWSSDVCSSDLFLRGGIGDEVPIQTFAARGYFVLVVDNLNHLIIFLRQPSPHSCCAAFNLDFSCRLNIVSSFVFAVRSFFVHFLFIPTYVVLTLLIDLSSSFLFSSFFLFFFSFFLP